MNNIYKNNKVSDNNKKIINLNNDNNDNNDKEKKLLMLTEF